jgi:tetratricopeptide (TPR) repeat protein
LDPEVPDIDRDRRDSPRRRRRKARADRRRLDQHTSVVIFALLGIAIGGSLLALGSVHVPAVLAMTPFALAAGGLSLLRDSSNRLPAPAVLFVALAAYSALQALPLPLGLLRLLDSHSASIWASALRPFGEESSRASLSLDPGASMVEALKWLSYAAAFVAAVSVTRRRDLRWIVSLVFGASVLAAGVTLGHRLVGAESFFGVYSPIYAAPKFATAPLLNANNLAGYLNLGAFAGLGLMVSRRPVLPIWVLGLLVAVVVGLSAVSGSRAGLACLLLGGSVTLVGLGLRRFGGRSTPLAVTALVGASLAGGLALFVLGADRDVWRALFEEGAQKLELISWTGPLVKDHLLFGVGRGAFETAFPAYRADQGHHLYQFAENFVMQWCAEWGVPVALAALLGFVWFLRPARLGVSRSPLAFVSFVAVSVLLAQNLVDLGLEVASIGLALAAMLGALWGDAPDDVAQSSVNLSPLKQPAVAFILAGAALWIGALIMGRNTALGDRRALAAAFKALPQDQAFDASNERAKLYEQLRLAVHRHPADPFLPIIGALSARSADQNPMPWIARAIERDPMAGRPYLLLAEVLAKRGSKEQTLLSIRQAVEREAALMRTGVRLAVLVSRDANELLRAAPLGPTGANMLTSLALQPELQAVRMVLLEAAVARAGSFSRPRLVLAEDLLKAIAEEKPPCVGAATSTCSSRVSTLALEIERSESSQEAPAIYRARLLAASARLNEAVAYLVGQCPRFQPGQDCLRWQVTLAHKARNATVLDASAASYLAAACENPRACAAAALWLGSQFDSLGDDAKALKMFERAAQESESPDAWRHVARLASRLGLVGAAQRAKEKAGRTPMAAPGDDAGREQTDRERLQQLIGDEH